MSYEGQTPQGNPYKLYALKLKYAWVLITVDSTGFYSFTQPDDGSSPEKNSYFFDANICKMIESNFFEKGKKKKNLEVGELKLNAYYELNKKGEKFYEAFSSLEEAKGSKSSGFLGMFTGKKKAKIEDQKKTLEDQDKAIEEQKKTLEDQIKKIEELEATNKILKEKIKILEETKKIVVKSEPDKNTPEKKDTEVKNNTQPETNTNIRKDTTVKSVENETDTGKKEKQNEKKNDQPVKTDKQDEPNRKLNIQDEERKKRLEELEIEKKKLEQRKKELEKGGN